MSLPGGRKAVLAALAVVVAVAAVVAGVLLTRGGPSDEVMADNGEEVTLAQEDTSSEPPTAEPLPPDIRPSETPEITPQATGLKEEKISELDSGPEKSDGAPRNLGSCDHNYGEPTQCVPWTFPDGITEYADKCLWLKLNGFATALEVVGKDRQRLDPDGNKIACDG